MVRHQWKEARNIVNAAMSKVIRPLQLKDLFCANVGADHAVYKERLSELSKELDKQKSQESKDDGTNDCEIDP